MPLLSALARAITRAGLTARLNSAGPATVFAPDNAAFAGLGSGNVTTLMSRKHDFAQVLRYLVVSSREVLCGNVPTSSGTIYILDKVLVPVLSRRTLSAWATPQPGGA
jgi:uncharacterized surface protein with fasciclin (FAS1) repeats